MNAFDRVKGMDRIFCGLYLLLGYGFIWMFTNSTSAWCLPVYTVFYAVVVLLYARILGIRPVKESWFWFVILLILGISQEIDNGMMVGRFLALLLVAAYWTFAVSGRLLGSGTNIRLDLIRWMECIGNGTIYQYGCPDPGVVSPEER